MTCGNFSAKGSEISTPNVLSCDAGCNFCFDSVQSMSASVQGHCHSEFWPGPQRFVLQALGLRGRHSRLTS